MTKEEVKQHAVKFCEEYGVDSYPVPIVQLCNNRGLQVFEEYLSSEVSGIIMVDETNMNKELYKKYGCNKFIVVNLVENAMRRRFTIAHELAHYELHSNGGSYIAHRDTTNGVVKSRTEREADLFATNVLMPEWLVRQAAQDMKLNYRGKIPNFLLVSLMAEQFIVSKQAMEIRLRELSII